MMAITDREFELFQKSINDKFETILQEIRDIKQTCSKRMDGCGAVMKEMRSDVDRVKADLTKIKTIGSLVVFLWTSAIALIPAMLRKLWSS